MPIITTQTDSCDNPNYTVAASYSNIVITTNAVVMSSNNTAVTIGTYAGVSVINAGTVSGYNGLVNRGSMTTIVNRESGVIFGYYNAVSSLETAQYTYIQNLGTIASNNTGVFMGGYAGSLDNSGSISAYNAVAALGANAFVNNSGTITAQNVALQFSSETLGGEFNNSGVVSGGTYAIYATSTVAIHNSGTLGGDVVFAAGNSSIDGVGGSIVGTILGGAGAERFDLRYMTVTGPIVGGLGSDTIIGTAQGDLIYGDNIVGDVTGGADTLSGGYGDDSIYGGYGADTILGNQGDDVLYGNQDNDWMHGGQGDDILYGGQGNDTLNGGLGDDTLFGNLGNDIFAVGAKFGHDLIGDFGVVPGNSDIVSFVPGTFNSYADVAAHMVQSGANVVLTLDADDGLVFANMTIAALTPDHFVFG